MAAFTTAAQAGGATVTLDSAFTVGGVTKTYLLSEWHKAQRAECTRDCRKGCTGCGMKRYEGACV